MNVKLWLHCSILSLLVFNSQQSTNPNLWVLAHDQLNVNGVAKEEPINQSPGKPTRQLYGRVEQFYADNGPEFPSFFLSSQKNELDSEQTELPKQLIGSWHGEVKMGKWVVLPACADFDTNYDKSVKAISKCREGRGSLTFENKKTGVSLKEGTVLFYLPAIYRLDELEAVFSHLTNITESDKEKIRQSMASVSASVVMRMGLRKQNDVLGYGITGVLKSRKSQMRHPKDNVYENDTVDEMEEHFANGKEPKIVYCEGLTKYVIQEYGSLQVTSATARYSEDKQLLHSDVWSGTFERGKVTLQKDEGNRFTLHPEDGGVRLSIVGANGEHVSLFLPGASVNQEGSR